MITVILPNYNYIKNRIREVFINEITRNNKNLRILSYVTIKHCKNPSTILRKSLIKPDNIRYFNSENISLTNIKKSEQIISKLVDDFHNHLEDSADSSPFTGIMKIDIKLSKSKNIFGGSFVELPENIKNKRACVNIKNNDDKCFLWSLIASKHYNDIKKIEVKHYKKYIDSVVIPDTATFPVSVDDIGDWEKANNMKINVFSLDEDETIKLEYNTIHKNKNVVNLLLYKNHYVWLKNIDRFDASNVSKNSVYRCMQCNEFRAATRELLNKHTQKCLLSDKSPDMNMPKCGKDTMKFINNQNQFMHPFHVVADFESTLELVEDINESSTTKYQRHIPNSYGLKYNCIHNEYSQDIKIFNSSNPDGVIESFINELESLCLYSYKLTKQNENNIIMTDIEKKRHRENKQCTECKCLYTKENQKVRHHDHITGKFISSICGNCNFKFKCKKFLLSKFPKFQQQPSPHVLWTRFF
jgi:hypothetical protein